MPRSATAAAGLVAVTLLSGCAGIGAGAASAGPSPSASSAQAGSGGRTPAASPSQASAQKPGQAPATRAPIDLLAVRRIVALGDSVTAGDGCDCDAFPDLVATALSERSGHSVAAVNDGQSGQTAHDLAAALDPTGGDPELRADLAGADLVLVTIGANDIATVEPDPQVLTSEQVAGAAARPIRGPARPSRRSPPT